MQKRWNAANIKPTNVKYNGAGYFQAAMFHKTRKNSAPISNITLDIREVNGRGAVAWRLSFTFPIIMQGVAFPLDCKYDRIAFPSRL
jgi:hypothetical protein